MTRLPIGRLFLIIAIAAFSSLLHAQPLKKVVPASKPYKILTSGKQVTVKSNINIKSIMVWTASGHRIVEQKEVNASSYSFTVTINEKYYFVMIQYEGQKPFTEKIGV